VGRERAGREARSCAEELGEVGRIVESRPPGALGDRDVGMREHPFRLEHNPVVDELLGAAADRFMRRPAQRARGVAQQPRVPGDLS
jgi:hypothetical protein